MVGRAYKQLGHPNIETGNSNSFEMAPESFQVVKENVLYSRYMTLYDRRVRFISASGEQELNYDVVGHPSSEFMYALTFPFHPYKDGAKGGEVTLVREYGQGPNDLVYCLPTGGFDAHKHETIEDCARAELSEEAKLSGGRWVRLTPEDHPGFIEAKWCINRGHPFLVIDPRNDSCPGERDFEEFSLQVLRVTIPELRKLMAEGNMLGPSIHACYMAMEWLQQEGLL